MYNIVKIGTKDVPMLSMASVDVYYKNIFHEDPLKVQTQAQGPDEAISFYTRMGFVMAKFAERRDRKEMAKLNEDHFIEWLDQFDRLDLMTALEGIQATYDGQSVTYTDAKKNIDAPSET